MFRGASARSRADFWESPFRKRLAWFAVVAWIANCNPSSLSINNSLIRCTQNERTKTWPMRIVARRALRRFVKALAGHQDQPAVKAAVDAWFDAVKKARWQNSADVQLFHATASKLNP